MLSILSAVVVAWTIGNPLDDVGCHERITAEAWKRAMAEVGDTTTQAPTRDERALLEDVEFTPPPEAFDDWRLGALLIAVRDPDLRGESVLDSLEVVRVHGDPDTQDSHCIRAAEDDGAAGNESALEACATVILRRARAAIRPGAVGTTDVKVHLAIAGDVDVPLPVFTVEVGAALHALQDAFTHTYRTGDGAAVTTVLNWIDFAEGNYDEARDGPEHHPGLDDCMGGDPLVERNRELAIEASAALLVAVIEGDDAALQAVVDGALRFEEGCTLDNEWCSAPETDVKEPGGCGCTVGGADEDDDDAWIAAVVILALLVIPAWLLRRRSLVVSLLLLALPATTRAQTTPEPEPEPGDTVSPAEPATTAVPDQDEPGRDIDTPTRGDLADVREDKILGPRWGGQATVGGSFLKGGLVMGAGIRYRITEKWIVGLDAEWNPWIRTSPLEMVPGVMNVYATGIRRYPMLFDRVNLRTTVGLGTSVLLYDVYGVPTNSVGLFVQLSPLGLDFDLGGAWRIIFDPAALVIPMPDLGQLPLVYEQYRMTVGLSWGG